MAAPVRIEAEAFSDERYEVLAAACGLVDADHARGKMARLWRQCTALGVYVLPASTVCAVLGPNGAVSIVESGLGELHEDGIRIRGTRGRIEWLKKLRSNAKKGGKAKAAKRQASGKPDGRAEAARHLPPACPLTPTLTPTLKEEVVPPPATPMLELQIKLDDVKASQHPGHREVIADFDARYLAAYGSKPTWTSVAGAHVKRLLKSHGELEVRRRIANLFDSPPSWLKPPFDFGTFVSQFDKLVIAAGSVQSQPEITRKVPKL